MKRYSTWFLALAVSMIASASATSADEAPYRIYAGRDYRAYSNQELQRRVFELERAVMQLQQRIYNLESAPPPVVVAPPPPPPWTCSVSAFSQTYVQTAATRGQAEAIVRQKCAAASHPMHCSNVQCSQ